MLLSASNFFASSASSVVSDPFVGSASFVGLVGFVKFRPYRSPSFLVSCPSMFRPTMFLPSVSLVSGYLLHLSMLSSGLVAMVLDMGRSLGRGICRSFVWVSLVSVLVALASFVARVRH